MAVCAPLRPIPREPVCYCSESERIERRATTHFLGTQLPKPGLDLRFACAQQPHSFRCLEAAQGPALHAQLIKHARARFCARKRAYSVPLHELNSGDLD